MTNRILIVDDSILFRKSLEKVFLEISEIVIIDSVWNGKLVLPYLTKDKKPDLITLDIEMPEMDGLETLKHIQKFNNTLIPEERIEILMISSKTVTGGAITMKALNLGAFDFILKPAGENPEQNLQSLRIQVENKIELFRTIKKDSNIVEVKNPHKYSKILDSKNKFSLIAVGISTGGPKALMDLLPDLSKVTDLPIIIAQHMPEGFTKSLASMLDKVCGHTVVEGRDGMDIEKGNIYLAPGGFNLLLKKIDDKVHIAINKNIAQNKYSPSVDQLFRSVASIYREELISIIMTGMGNDGTAGISTVKRLGGYIIAQDKESSIVWGMPGRAIETGHVDIVLGIKDIADHISTLCR